MRLQARTATPVCVCRPSAIAARNTNGLAVLPEKLKGGAAKAVVAKLVDQGLLEEIRVKRREPHWRVEANEHPIGLKLTRWFKCGGAYWRNKAHWVLSPHIEGE